MRESVHDILHTLTHVSLWGRCSRKWEVGPKKIVGVGGWPKNRLDVGSWPKKIGGRWDCEGGCAKESNLIT